MYLYFAALLGKIPSGLISKLSLSHYPCSAKGFNRSERVIKKHFDDTITHDFFLFE